MKINKLIFSAFFMVFNPILTVCGASILYVQNNYRKPIQIKINGQEIRGTFIKTGERVRTIAIDHLQSLAIKTPESLQYKNLDNEVNAIKNHAFSNQNKDAILTIPDTNNILYWKPGIIAWQSNPGQQVITPDPTQKFINQSISDREMLNILRNFPYHYGQDCAQKIDYLLINKPQLMGQLETEIRTARILGKSDFQKVKKGVIDAVNSMYNHVLKYQFK